MTRLKAQSVFRIAWARSQAWSDADVALLGQGLFEPVQIFGWSARGKVVTMDCAHHLTTLMPEHVGHEALHESKLDQGRAALLLPPIGGRANSVHVPQELATQVVTVRVLGVQLDEAGSASLSALALK